MFTRASDDLRDRKQQRSLRRDVRDEDRARLLRHMVEELVHVDLDERAHALPREHARAVLEIRRQHLVARLQVERARGEVHARRRVLDEGQIVRTRADVRAECGAGLGEQRVEAAGDEMDGLALELPLPVLVALEDRTGAGPEGAVVEERDLGIELEELFQCRPTLTVP